MVSKISSAVFRRAPRTGRWFRASGSRGCSAQVCPASKEGPARCGPGPAPRSSRRRRAPPPPPAGSDTGPQHRGPSSTNCGSGDTLNSPIRCGLSPNAFHMRCTDHAEIPTAAAIDRVDQCVAPTGASSRVLTITSSTFSSVIRRGGPGLGSSSSPPNRRSANRRRHFDTVASVQPSEAAIDLFVSPAAAPRTIRHRSARDCDDLRRLTHRSSVSRSPAVSTTTTARRPLATTASNHRPQPHTPYHKQHHKLANQDTGWMVSNGNLPQSARR